MAICQVTVSEYDDTMTDKPATVESEAVFTASLNARKNRGKSSYLVGHDSALLGPGSLSTAPPSVILKKGILTPVSRTASTLGFLKFSILCRTATSAAFLLPSHMSVYSWNRRTPTSFTAWIRAVTAAIPDRFFSKTTYLQASAHWGRPQCSRAPDNWRFECPPTLETECAPLWESHHTATTG